jgi:hypothetical protein
VYRAMKTLKLQGGDALCEVDASQMHDGQQHNFLVQAAPAGAPHFVRPYEYEIPVQIRTVFAQNNWAVMKTADGCITGEETSSDASCHARSGGVSARCEPLCFFLYQSSAVTIWDSHRLPLVPIVWDS